jgi:hypothetical protein
MASAGGLVADYDLSKDSDAREFALGYFGDTKGFNEARGTKLVEHHAANERIIVFDDPTMVCDENEGDHHICAFAAKISCSPSSRTAAAIGEYLAYMGVKQEAKLQLLVIAY